VISREFLNKNKIKQNYMSRTSKKYFEKGLKNSIWDYFYNEVKKAKNGKELDLILNRYLPPDEKNMFEKRLGMFYLLKEGKGSREIGRQMDITLKTISFIKRGFKPPVKRKIKPNIKIKEYSVPDWALKKNSIMPTRVGKGRWNV
jgi:Trp operon repressor